MMSLILSLGWEVLERVFPFVFAVESPGNKLGDIGVNIIAFSQGLRYRKSNLENMNEGVKHEPR